MFHLLIPPVFHLSEEEKSYSLFPCPPVTTASEERRAREQAEKVFVLMVSLGWEDRRDVPGHTIPKTRLT